MFLKCFLCLFPNQCWLNKKFSKSLSLFILQEDRENILRARASGKGVLTSPFKLLKSNHLGVVLTFAVYDTDLPPDATEEQRVEATIGYSFFFFTFLN